MNTYSPSWDWPLTCLLTNYQTFPTGWWLLHPSMTRNHNPEPIELKISKETQKPSHVARWIGIVAVALIAFLLTTSSALAQATGQVSGVVTDPTGAVVPAASVTLRNLDTNAIRTITANKDARYDFTNVQPGSYSVTATSTGFSSYTAKVIVTVGGHFTVDAKLTLASNTTIEVSADQSVQVNTESPE